MAYYYKINDTEVVLPSYKGFHLQKAKKSKVTGPEINFDFTKHVLIELLDDVTPETKLWKELGLTGNKNIVHKRMIIDSHRIKCRRAIIICISSDIAKQLAERLSQTNVMGRNICAIIVEDMLTDLRLFEKQIMQFGDKKTQQQLLYVSDLNRCQKPSGLVRYLKEKFSPFGTILSILVCADDDKNAFPEGVIKFAYLSEAFAAELALDQFIMGRERLSVTVHHNILLSQCDLRARLRNAQWSNDSEYPILTESHYLSCSLPLNSDDNLKISCKENSTEKDFNRSSCDNRSNASYLKCNFNSKKQSVLNNESHTPDCSQNILNSNKTADYKVNSMSTSSTDNLCCTASNNKTTVIIDNNLANNLDNVEKLNLKQFSQNMCISANLVRHCDQKIQVSRNRHNFEVVKNPNCQFKCSESESNSDSYHSCKNDHNNSFHSDLNIPPENTILTNVEFSYDDNTLTQDYPEFSQLKAFSSTPINNTNELEVKMKPTKTTSKRKKRFIPSQKLCLKSQRIGLSQSENKNTITGSENSLCSSQQPSKSTSVLKNNLYASTISAEVLDHDLSSLTKVSDWLSHLPKSNDIEHVGKAKKNFDLFHEQSGTNASHCNRKISIYTTPSLKQNFQIGVESSLSNKSCIENEEPNKSTLIVCNENDVILTENFKSPLQKWLKQELVSSINNTVISCEDMSKCFVVYATRSQDVAVSVGCSHMTCDSCYPGSTDLLLGYG